MYKRILVATGGSPWSDAAVTYAIALAAHLGAELRILTVLSGPMGYTMPDVMSSSELLVESVERQG
jgi:nucleotide-binding universal stress UspA family protein